MVALYTSDGIQVGTYSYDPYGGITEISHNDNYKDTDGILEKNPFRYRSYYFDTETGWYYLNSRYYDPQVKRFINGDSTQLLTNTPENLMQYNLFMYCNGDPVDNVDYSGHIAIGILYMSVLISVFYGASEGIIAVASECEVSGEDWLSVHWNRNKYNRIPDDLSVVINTWEKVSESESIFHRLPCESQINLDATIEEYRYEYNYNEKYIHVNEDGSSYEAVICRMPNGKMYLVEDPKNLGIYNFCSPVNEFSFRWISTRVAHGVADVLPYKMWGNAYNDI